MRGAQHFFRFIRVAHVLAKYDVLAPKELKAVMPRSARIAGVLARLGLRRDRGATLEERLAHALVQLGPAYIKLGQMLATRPDIVGSDLAKALSKLQDRLPPFPLEEAKQILEEDLGEDWETYFVALEPASAAASIAQVHKARMLRDEEETEVAVKILRPDIDRIFRRDLKAVIWLAEKIERFFPATKRLEPVLFVETIRKSVDLELDLRLEAAAAVELGDAWADSQRLHVPTIYWNQATKNILVTEWLDGIPLHDLDALDAAGVDRKQLADEVIQLFLIQALRDGYFHADMHAGNLFLINSEEDCFKIGAVDFGIMGRIDKQSRRFLAEILYGFVVRDYDSVAEAHFKAGYVPAHHSKAEFAQALRAIGEPVFFQGADQISMARLLAQLFETTRMFDMHLQPQLVLLQKTMVMVEGVARNLYPTHNMWEAAEPVVEEWVRTSIGPEARLADIVEQISVFADLVKRLPEIADDLQTVARAFNDLSKEGGIKLHPETANELARAERRYAAGQRAAIWIATTALVVIALGFFV